jgi:hypothetical protein
MGSTRIPAIVFCIYQLMFAAITYVLGPLPLFILHLHLRQSYSRHRSRRGAFPTGSSHGLRLHLVDSNLQRNCVLDMEF